MTNEVVEPTNIEAVKKQFESFLNNTEESRTASERDRDFKDNKQWTAEEEAVLNARPQAVVTVNRLHPKIEGLKGLLVQRKTDPKAFPRTQKHERAAEAITDGLRFVADNNNFDHIKIEVADNFWVEGTGGVILVIKQKNKEAEIVLERIPWDRLYYDPHSRRGDFKDAKFTGLCVWMDLEDVRETFPGTDVDLLMGSQGDGDGTFEDRPKWIDRKRNRIRVCQHYFLVSDVWHVAFFSGNHFLKDPVPVPLVNEEDESINPMILVSAYMDRENNRFGEVRYWIDLQREINHRRSKALHLLSTRQTKGRKGSIKDVPALKRELAKADGHVEVDGEITDFDVLNTGDMAQAQFNLLVESKQELDSIGFNAQLSGERQGDLSGKAIANLQQASTNELAASFNVFNDWEKRVYTHVWFSIKQFWDREKWIRVMDDEKQLRWVGLNTEMTLQQVLEEQINDKSRKESERKESAALFQGLLQAQSPRLGEIHEVRNKVSELDVDIIIEQSLDVVNIQQEQFELISKISAGRPEVPFTAILKLSAFREKDALIKKIEEGEQAAREALQQQGDKDSQKIKAELQGKQLIIQAETAKELFVAEKKLELQQALDAQRLSMERELNEVRKDFEARKFEITKAVELHKFELTKEVEVFKAQIQAAAHIHEHREKGPSEVKTPDLKSLSDAINKLAAANKDSGDIDKLINAIGKPKKLSREKDGTSTLRILN